MGERDNNLNMNAALPPTVDLLLYLFFSPFISSFVLNLVFFFFKLHFVPLTFFLWCGSFFIPSLLVSRAAVSLLLQDVADEDTQQAHHAEDGHQSEHGVLSRFLLSAAYHCAVDRPSCTARRTFTHCADRSDMQGC